MMIGLTIYTLFCLSSGNLSQAIKIDVMIKEGNFANVVDKIYLGATIDMSLLTVKGLRKDINLKLV